MGFFIFTLVVLTVGALAFAAGVILKSGKSAGVGALALLFGGILMAVACIDQVPTRNVGIVVSGQKPTGRTTGAGWQTHKPWQHVDEWDASGQTYAHLGDRCVWLSIAAQRRACIPVQIEWAAKPERAPENWAAYKAVGDDSRFDTWVKRRVEPQMNATLASLFAGFDPLGNVDPKSGDAPAPDLNKAYRDQLAAALNAALGVDITIKSVAFEAPRYDDPTNAAIAAYGQKVLEARNLKIDEENAVTRARITATDAKVDQVARCLQIAEKLGKEPGLCMNPLGALAQTGGK